MAFVSFECQERAEKLYLVVVAWQVGVKAGADEIGVKAGTDKDGVKAGADVWSLQQTPKRKQDAL
jgi:hypothetical protein